ncbi:MAG: sodium:solute symporter family protein [Longimicrobiales bacterium]|nr:sodium:solute symporter family protein [Longimicrobiales bacterium]
MGGTPYLIVILVYLLLMCGIGIYFAKRRVHTGDEFMLAGRSLPLWVMMGTLLATWVGSGTIVGGAAFTYQRGPLATIFFHAGVPIGILVLYFFLAERVRKLSKLTIPELLEDKYGPLARVLAAICILLAYIGITSYQFIGGGYVLNLTTGIPVGVGSAITAGLVVFLAITGGLFSVAYTDALSALLILFGLVVGLPFALGAAGGMDFFQELPPIKRTWTGGLTLPQTLGYFLPLLMLILGEQNMYQRFAAARDSATAKRANVGFFVGAVVVLTLVTLMASSAAILYPAIHPDTAVLTVAMDAMPFLVGAPLLAAAVAFIITTGDSYLLSCSTNVTHDFYVRFFNPEASQTQRLWITRGVVFSLGIVAWVLGTFFPSVLAIQMYSYTMYGAAITPAVLAALLWKRVTAAGGIASILLGGGGTLLWELGLNKPMGWNSILFSLPLSVAALVFVSLATQRPEPET